MNGLYVQGQHCGGEYAINPNARPMRRATIASSEYCLLLRPKEEEMLQKKKKETPSAI
jgi:hypothetical protein